MTNGEVIQRIQSLYSKGVQSDDSRLRPRHIYSKIITVRALLLHRQASKKQKISQWNYQTLPCVELIEASPHECGCEVPVGCTIQRSVYPLPSPVSDLGSHLIQNVSSVDGSVFYSEVSWQEKKYKSGSKYTANKPDFFIRNGYLFLTHRRGPKIVSITGLFQDPLEAENFPSACEESCSDCESFLDKEFHLDASLIEPLVQMSVEELIGIFSQNIEDTTNNSTDSVAENSK